MGISLVLLHFLSGLPPRHEDTKEFLGYQENRERDIRTSGNQVIRKMEKIRRGLHPPNSTTGKLRYEKFFIDWASLTGGR